MASFIDHLYDFYTFWVSLFHGLPLGDPWLAIFSLGLILMTIGKVLKEILRPY